MYNTNMDIVCFWLYCKKFDSELEDYYYTPSLGKVNVDELITMGQDLQHLQNNYADVIEDVLIHVGVI